MEPFAPAKWGELAQALGLALHDPVGPYGAGLTFKGLKRVLGAPARAVTSAWQWMYGRHGKVEVVVAPWLGQKAISLVARIDPPLFLGLHAMRNAARWFDLAGYDRDRVRAALDVAPRRARRARRGVHELTHHGQHGRGRFHPRHAG